jgi:hypothetical protein
MSCPYRLFDIDAVPGAHQLVHRGPQRLRHGLVRHAYRLCLRTIPGRAAGRHGVYAYMQATTYVPMRGRAYST